MRRNTGVPYSSTSYQLSGHGNPMPEGDTIHKLANALAPELTGRAVRLTLIRPGVRRTSSRTVTAVSAQGKHLWIEFTDGELLRTHLGMYGSWHRYRPGEGWQKPARQASVLMETADTVYVCFNAREAELVQGRSLRYRSLQTRLGPDLLAPGCVPEEIPARARDILDPATPLADVLLDQRVACGIGNVYKSEVLFLHGLHPLTPLTAVSDERLRDLYATAADLLSRNLGGGPRVTRFENDGAGVLWVYRRKGQACFRCGQPIRHARLGKDWRGTYWCPECQKPNPPAR